MCANPLSPVESRLLTLGLTSLGSDSKMPKNPCFWPDFGKLTFWALFGQGYVWLDSLAKSVSARWLFDVILSTFWACRVCVNLCVSKNDVWCQLCATRLIACRAMTSCHLSHDSHPRWVTFFGFEQCVKCCKTVMSCMSTLVNFGQHQKSWLNAFFWVWGRG